MMNDVLLKKTLKKYVLNNGVPLKMAGINSFGFYRSDALEIIKLLGELGILILGGDVYKISNNSIIPTYDNWSTTRDENNINSPMNSARQSIDFISSYKEKNNDNFLYVLVIDSTELFLE